MIDYFVAVITQELFGVAEMCPGSPSRTIISHQFPVHFEGILKPDPLYSGRATWRLEVDEQPTKAIRNSFCEYRRDGVFNCLFLLASELL